MKPNHTFFICYYTLNDQHRTAISEYGVLDFKNGFWIDKQYKLTLGFDQYIWVPPHCIEFIEKVNTFPE